MRAGSSSSRGAGGWAAGLAVLLLCAAVLLAGGATASVFDRDEARFALAVREMREHGELLVPSNFGAPRYHKPILAYWCALGADALLGHGEFALRLPSALAGLGAVAATMALARRRYGARVAVRAGAILGTSFLFVQESKILTADALLLLTTTLAFWAWLERREGGGRGWQLLFWLALALGLLAKGVNVAFLAAAGAALVLLRLAREGRRPWSVLVVLAAGSCAAAVPALAFLGPLACVAVALALLRRGPWRAAWRASGASWGVPLCLALVGAWLVPALVRSHGEFWSEGVGHHMLGRTASAFEGHAGFPGYYLVTSALFLFPLAAGMPSALSNAWREPRREFLLAWVVGPWALVECMASKLPHYVLVTLPALAVLVALEWERRDAFQLGLRRLERGLFLLPCLALAAAGAWLARESGGELQRAALGLTALALVTGALALVLAKRSGAGAFALVAGGAFALYLWLGALVLPALEPQRLAPRLGGELARLALPGETIHLVRWRPASVGYYAPAGHPLVEDQDELAAALASKRPGLFVVEGERLERFLSEHPGTWVTLSTLHGLRALGPEEVVVLRRGAG